MILDWNEPDVFQFHGGLGLAFNWDVRGVPTEVFPGDTSWSRDGPGDTTFNKDGPGDTTFNRNGPGGVIFARKGS